MTAADFDRVAPLRIDGIGVEGAGFSLTAEDCPQTLTFGASCHAKALFKPPAPGDYDGALLLSSNDPDGALGRHGGGPHRRRHPDRDGAGTSRARARDLVHVRRARRRHRDIVVTTAAGRGARAAAAKTTAKAKAIVVATGKRTFSKAGRGSIKVRLTASGQRLLRRPRAITLTVRGTFTPRSGKPLSASNKVKLKR